MKNNRVAVYIGVAFGWSYLLWIKSFILAGSSGFAIKFHGELFEAVQSGRMQSSQWMATAIAILATYGPLVASILVRKRQGGSRSRRKSSLTLGIFLQAVGMILLITFIPGILVVNQVRLPQNGLSALLLVLVFFIYQLFTSGTEEFGWRGFLLPEFLKRYTLWQAGIRVGIIWAVWHYPVAIYMFIVQGMNLIQIVTSMIGFTAGIIGMSVLHSYFYNRSRSVMLAVFIHAFANTLPMILGLFAEDAYMVSVMSQFVLWGVLMVLTKVKKETFNALPQQLAGN